MNRVLASGFAIVNGSERLGCWFFAHSPASYDSDFEMRKLRNIEYLGRPMSRLPTPTQSADFAARLPSPPEGSEGAREKKRRGWTLLQRVFVHHLSVYGAISGE